MSQKTLLIFKLFYYKNRCSSLYSLWEKQVTNKIYLNGEMNDLVIKIVTFGCLENSYIVYFQKSSKRVIGI